MVYKAAHTYSLVPLVCCVEIVRSWLHLVAVIGHCGMARLNHATRLLRIHVVLVLVDLVRIGRILRNTGKHIGLVSIAQFCIVHRTSTGRLLFIQQLQQSTFFLQQTFVVSFQAFDHTFPVLLALFGSLAVPLAPFLALAFLVGREHRVLGLAARGEGGRRALPRPHFNRSPFHIDLLFAILFVHHFFGDRSRGVKRGLGVLAVARLGFYLADASCGGLRLVFWSHRAQARQQWLHMVVDQVVEAVSVRVRVGHVVVE
ncbi:hypothetical protein BpHYR1_015678 [Brachionus plicatilis]|uniref:Uncharacterized protein n=1 Tax=Brachionus plicatilis TaxID=10195 RepID=A0A3M7S2D3_BRAPC|nr:hypothetical protein BpHYR1_015678 [Brachionus plicatilis]